MVKPSLVGDSADRDIVISRVLHAPADLVWQAWTDPQQAGQWWGPYGFTTTTHAFDLRPGGEWRFTMHGPDGRDYPNRIVFEVVDRPRRLVYRHEDAEDAKAVCFHHTMTLEPVGEDGRQTRVTMRMVFPSPEDRRRVVRDYSAGEGALQHVDRLAEYLAEQSAEQRGERRHTLTVSLPSEREVVLQRAFDAPRDLVFEAFARPERLRRWWGCGDTEIVTCAIDFRPGGTWRIVLREPNGTVHPFHGEYREIVRPELIVQTFVYEVDMAADHPALETIRFATVEDRTILTNYIEHDAQASRDEHLSSGLEIGATMSMDRLASLLGELRRAPAPV